MGKVILAQARIQGARVYSLLDAGFHRHDEVLLGFTPSGQALHFYFSL
ncbi:MAG: hypothetical protein MUF69_04195 [Desulfobacterota bacterium]|jgi:hypothetical protein|nr:hypothetical protein [Thermodesulfobacteriota bacterium]